MSNRLRVFTISILGFLVVTTLLYFTNHAKNLNSPQQQPTDVDAESPIAISHGSPPDAETPVAAKKDESFSAAIKICFPEQSSSINNPTEFVNNWKSIHPTSKEKLDFIHYFFRNSDGAELRAQMLYHYVNGRPVRELKMYRVLADGLPDPIKIPETDAHNPSDTTLSKYINYDLVFETQKKWSSRVSRTTSIEVEESNSLVTEFQLFHDKITFRCHEGDCVCLNRNL